MPSPAMSWWRCGLLQERLASVGSRPWRRAWVRARSAKVSLSSSRRGTSRVRWACATGGGRARLRAGGRLRRGRGAGRRCLGSSSTHWVLAGRRRSSGRSRGCHAGRGRAGGNRAGSGAGARGAGPGAGTRVPARQLRSSKRVTSVMRWETVRRSASAARRAVFLRAARGRPAPGRPRRPAGTSAAASWSGRASTPAHGPGRCHGLAGRAAPCLHGGPGGGDPPRRGHRQDPGRRRRRGHLARWAALSAPHLHRARHLAQRAAWHGRGPDRGSARQSRRIRRADGDRGTGAVP